MEGSVLRGVTGRGANRSVWHCAVWRGVVQVAVQDGEVADVNWSLGALLAEVVHAPAPLAGDSNNPNGTIANGHSGGPGSPHHSAGSARGSGHKGVTGYLTSGVAAWLEDDPGGWKRRALIGGAVGMLALTLLVSFVGVVGWPDAWYAVMGGVGEAGWEGKDGAAAGGESGEAPSPAPSDASLSSSTASTAAAAVVEEIRRLLQPRGAGGSGARAALPELPVSDVEAGRGTPPEPGGWERQEMQEDEGSLGLLRMPVKRL